MPNITKLELIVITTYCIIVQCFSICLENCIACAGSSTCYACKDGYFLYDKDCLRCPVTCRICIRIDLCTDCQPNYWNLTFQCGMKCPFNCLSGCDVTTGNCFGCKTNFYGKDCAQSCSLCRNGFCDFQGCTSGCYDGYFQDIYQGYSLCRQCSPNCSKCEKFNNCTECQPNFFIHEHVISGGRVSECKSCSPGCASCIDVDRCVSCQGINNCKECKYNGYDYTCSVCDNGWYAENGQCSAERQCPAGCLNGCDISGACYQCRDGFTGSACNFICSDLCLRCSKNNPDICEQCKNADLLTPMCTEDCSENCLKINGKSTCQLENGKCLNGCLAGSWGAKCENNCSINCIQNANSQPDCNLLTGSCTYGCVTGFTGQACDGKVTTIRETLNTSNTPNVGQPNVAAVVGALSGGIVVGAVSVIIVFILWKRLRKKPQFHSNVYENAGIDISQHDENPTSSIELSVPSSETSVYEHLSEKTNENNYSVLTK